MKIYDGIDSQANSSMKTVQSARTGLGSNNCGNIILYILVNCTTVH